jgi:transcriptional regulator with XRE-family HTH domain
MKKRTDDDDAFIAQFAPALKREYEKAKRKGITDQAFAESIGVERPSLTRYLDGESMPSVRTVAFAHRDYRIAVPYSGVSLQDALPKTVSKTRKKKPVSQLVFPFFIQTKKTTAKVGIRLDPVSDRKFTLSLIVDQAG